MDTLADLRTNSCFNKVRNFNYREVALYKVCSDSQAKPVVHRSPDCLDKEDGGAGSLQGEDDRMEPVEGGEVLASESLNLKVKDVISSHGWNWSAIPFDLPQNIKESIQAVPFPIAARSVAKLAWKGSSKGGFSSKGVYNLATQIPTLPKIQMFIWQCMHTSVGVRCCLAERGLHISTDCPLCHSEPESISHALRDCKFVKPIWQQLGHQRLNHDFYFQGTRDWLASHARAKASHCTDGREIRKARKLDFGLLQLYRTIIV
ncbi:hypothetical protein CMV_014464 [Castanea mollissima]|uniref:Reverse transcriptase zinc-binding domain-containing protein n=1 Tax=Castanea mollissima TaxID=60419 RepID=A0A8J4R6P9_9ROSI|nr:hypothetical protein CMV_014464 [Castanea mollissima]